MAPLVSSLDSCILFVDPSKHHLDQLDLATKHGLVLRFRLLGDAISAANVPSHFVVSGHGPENREWLVTLNATDQQRVHTIGDEGPAWSNSGVASALAAEHKPNLLICGFWLETAVSFIALHALYAGFDVLLIMDATPSNVENTREASSARLLQAGVVPTTTHQLFAEWGEQSADAKLRTDLAALLE